MTIDWPLDHNHIRRGAENNTFGMVRRSVTGAKKPHQGWDLEAAPGTPCYAVADGKIAVIRDGGDYGLTIVLRFKFEGADHYAAYSHLSAASVKLGEMVSMGQMIGKTGNSGNAKSMKGADQHLHFELRTMPTPGLGLGGRLSPIKIFGVCPLKEAVKRKALTDD